MKPQVLVIESRDEDAARITQDLQSVLQHTVDVSHVATLHDACKQIVSQAVDIIVLDLNLSDSTGLSTLQSLRKIIGDKPVIVLTDEDEASLTAQVLVMGGLVMAKLADKSKLGLAVASAIETHQKRFETRDTVLDRIEAMSRLLIRQITEFDQIRKSISELRQDSFHLHAATEQNTVFRRHRQRMEVVLVTAGLFGSLFTAGMMLYLARGLL